MFAAGMVNLKRDPFEMGWGEEKKANFWFGGALAARERARRPHRTQNDPASALAS